jgi:preprotein translocase subunit SecE
MAREESAAAAADRSWWQELLRFDLYKRTQGRYYRQGTFLVLAVLAAAAFWSLYILLQLQGVALPVRLGTCGGLFAVSLWAFYRLVNYPKFADFLIGVEAEMFKVTWPTWGELVTNSIVVIVTIFGFALLLFGYDLFWRWALKGIGL